MSGNVGTYGGQDNEGRAIDAMTEVLEQNIQGMNDRENKGAHDYHMKIAPTISRLAGKLLGEG